MITIHGEHFQSTDGTSTRVVNVSFNDYSTDNISFLDNNTLTVSVNATRLSPYMDTDTYVTMRLDTVDEEYISCECTEEHLRSVEAFPDLYSCCQPIQNLFAADSSCTPLIQYTDQVGQCQLCPEGAYCPGDVRLWSLEGFWNPNEITVPARCAIQEACLGSFPEEQLPPCCCGEGYQGFMCSQCQEEFYALAGLCISCTARSDYDILQLQSLIIVFISFTIGVSLAVAFLNDLWLDRFAVLFISIQQSIQVGLAAVQYLPTRLITLLQSMSFLLFDYEFIKPGCIIGFTRFNNLFWATVGFVCLAWVSFLLAALFRHSNIALLLYCFTFTRKCSNLIV